MPNHDPHRPLLRPLLGVTAGIVVTFLAVFTAGRLVGVHVEVKRLVDLGAEGNLPTWWSAGLLLTTALLAVVAARGSSAPRERRAWWVVAAAAGYLSLDETAGLHERLGLVVRATDLEVPTYAWVLPGLVVAAVGATVLVWAGRGLPERVGRSLAVVLAVYLTGALGFEALGGWLRANDGDAVFTVAVTVEESLEMVAAVWAVALVHARVVVLGGGAQSLIGVPGRS